jgi:hypothetical protein
MAVSVRYGFIDRPDCDPRAIAKALGLKVVEARLPAHSFGDVIVIPGHVSEQAKAYFTAHEIGHFLLNGEAPCEELERACSRIGTALMLPRESFARDLQCASWAALGVMWPLATRTVLRRRAAEIQDDSISLHAFTSSATFRQSAR